MHLYRLLIFTLQSESIPEKLSKQEKGESIERFGRKQLETELKQA